MPLVLVLELEQGTVVLYGKLCDYRNCLEVLAMPPDVVAIYLLEDPTCFKPPFDCHLARLDVGLHPLVLDRVAWVVRALDLVGGANVAIVGLNALARLKEVPKDLVEDLDVGELSGWIGTLDPHQVPTQNTYPGLVPEGGLARILVGGKPVACGCLPCLRDPKICPID